MAIRIVHFGADTFSRVAALEGTGYSVHLCYSLAELHAVLVGVLPADAVVIAEHDGTLIDNAISLIRATSAVPLILFRNSNHHSNRHEVDLVVPSDPGSDKWLSDIAELFARSSQSDPLRNR